LAAKLRLPIMGYMMRRVCRLLEGRVEPAEHCGSDFMPRRAEEEFRFAVQPPLRPLAPDLCLDDDVIAVDAY
jgi:hypothetical protein